MPYFLILRQGYRRSVANLDRNTAREANRRELPIGPQLTLYRI